MGGFWRQKYRSTLEGKGFNWLEFNFDQLGRKKLTATLGRNELAPQLHYNLISATSAFKASDKSATITNEKGRIGCCEGAYHFILKNGVYVVDTERAVLSASIGTVAETGDIRYHRFMGYGNDQQTRARGKHTGQSSHRHLATMCRVFDGQSSPRRSAENNYDRVISKRKRDQLFTDLSHPKGEKSIEECRYVMITT